MKGMICEICGIETVHHWKRCDEHYCCDDCSTKNELITYCEGVLCETCHTERVEKRIAEFQGDTEFTDLITCPWCGDVINDSWEYSSDTDEIECDDCGRKYSMGRHVEITYTTHKIEPK